MKSFLSVIATVVVAFLSLILFAAGFAGLDYLAWHHGVCQACGGRMVFTEQTPEENYQFTCENCGIHSTYIIKWDDIVDQERGHGFKIKSNHIGAR